MRRFRLQGDGVKNELLILDTKCSVKNANLLQGICYVIFQKRVRVFHRGFKHEKN